MECSGVTLSQILYNHSIVTVKMEEKTSKTWRVRSWTNKITRPFPIGPQIVYSPNRQKKSSPAFANLWLLLVWNIKGFCLVWIFVIVFITDVFVSDVSEFLHMGLSRVYPIFET